MMLIHIAEDYTVRNEGVEGEQDTKNEEEIILPLLCMNQISYPNETSAVGKSYPYSSPPSY